jgi:surface carbohydrate biosynthesis protein
MTQVLNLEWTDTRSRDREAATLVCNYLRYQGIKVIEGSIFEGYKLIDELKPDVLLMTNAIGAKINHKVLCYAKKRGVRCITLISEGDFVETEEKINQMIWGWNKSKVLLEDYHLQWSNRTRKLTLQRYPEIENKVKVSGSVGFDLYKISQNVDSNIIKKKYKVEAFNKVVGIASWNFGVFSNTHPDYEKHASLVSKDEIRLFRQDRVKLNKVLKEVISLNGDTLFLLKLHPITRSLHETEFENLDDLPNTLIIKNEESVHSCIGISDVWVSYNSTTSLEAWLLNKPTFNINPTRTDFIRSKLYEGSPNFKTSQEVNNALKSLYSSGFIPEVEKLNQVKHKLVKEISQWSDGLNHVRAGNFIIDFLNSSTTEIVNETNSLRLVRIKRNFKNTILKVLYSLTRKQKFNRTFESSNFLSYSRIRWQEQLEFYKKNKLKKEDLRKIEINPNQLD